MKVDNRVMPYQKHATKAQQNRQKATSDVTNNSEDKQLDYAKVISEKVEELQEKIKNGETEVAYPIGAGAFTKKEWDKLLEKFDAVEDAIRETMREEHEDREEKLKEQAIQERKKEEEKMFTGERSSLLVTEYTTYVSSGEHDGDKGELHITCYTKEGIICRRAGQKEDFEWAIPFENEMQYEKVVAFVRHLPNGVDKKFTIQKEFWEEFLRK